MGWFLLERFVDLLRVFPLHINIRNYYSNKFLLINLQETKTRLG